MPQLISMMGETYDRSQPNGGGLFWYGNYALIRSPETGKWFARPYARSPSGRDAAVKPLLGPFDSLDQVKAATTSRPRPRYSDGPVGWEPSAERNLRAE